MIQVAESRESGMSRPPEKRERIKQALLEVVVRKGLLETTVQDIAFAADVSPGLLYRYWEHRDDLACAVYREHYDALLETLEAQAADAPDAWEKFRRMLRSFLEFADREPTVLKFLLFTQHDLAAHIDPDEGVRAVLERLIREGLVTRASHVSPELAVQFTLGLILQPVVGYLYGHVPGPLSGHADEVLAAIERTLER